MKLMKRFVAIILSAVCTLMLCVAVAASAVSEPKAIGREDFALKLEKGGVNILTEGYDAILKASGKKFTKIKKPGTENYNYVLKTNGYTFYAYAGARDVFCYNLAYTKKSATPRGIKIGSTEKALLAAYPEPSRVDMDSKYIYYDFCVPFPAAGWANNERDALNDTRPVYFYMLSFTVNKKNKRVTAIKISSSAVADSPIINRSYIGTWYANKDKLDDLKIFKIDANTIEFEMSIFRLTAVYATAKINNNEIVFGENISPDYDGPPLRGTLEFHKERISVTIRESGFVFIEAGTVFDFSIKDKK